MTIADAPEWFAYRDEETKVFRICIKCEQSLEEYDDEQGCCRDCQQPFDWDDETTYKSTRTYRPWQFWFPGVCLAYISGIVSYAICMKTGVMGAALFIAVPISAGAIFGYSLRVGKFAGTLLGAILALSIAISLICMNVAGIFCGLYLAVCFLGPVLFGMLLGSILRICAKSSSWNQRHFLPLVFFVLLPYAVQAVECRMPPCNEWTTVSTGLHVDATPEEAWNAIMFYEEVEHQSPWLLQLALPKPIRSIGNKQVPGQVVKCIYDRGHILKRIGQVETNERLAFEVIEQKVHFERDVTLKSGSFTITPANRTDPKAGVYIRLQTDYLRHLRPAILWRSAETKVVRTLHGHVLEGMRRHILQQRQDRKEMLEPEYQPLQPGDSQPLVDRGVHTDQFQL